MENRIIILNPEYKLKNDNTRIILYSRAKTSSQTTPQWKSYIHPVQAMIFSFFTTERNFDETLNLLQSFLNKDRDNVLNIIKPYIENERIIITQYKDIQIEFPRNILIDKQKNISDALLTPLKPEELFCSSIDVESLRDNIAPHTLTLMLTNRCMTHCKYCYADTHHKVETELSIETYEKVIQNAIEKKVANINILGGEVFLKRDWHILLKLLVSNGYEPDFISTKIPITEDIASKLQSTGYSNVIQLSIDSFDSETLHELINANNTYAEKIKEGMKILEEYGFTVQINTVLTTLNMTEEQIKKMAYFFDSCNNIEYWELRTPIDSLYTDKTAYQKLKPAKENIENFISFIKNEIEPNCHVKIIINSKSLKDYSHSKNDEDTSFKENVCSALWDHLFILPDGKVTICEQLYWIPQFIIGDINHNSIEEIWNSPKALQLANLCQSEIQENSKCKECTIFDKCFTKHKRCWANIIKAYGVKNWDYPDPRCEQAPDIHDITTINSKVSLL